MNEIIKSKAVVWWQDWKQTVVKIITGYLFIVWCLGNINDMIKSASSVSDGASGIVHNVMSIEPLKRDLAYVDAKGMATSDSIQTAIFRCDVDGNCIYANDALAKMFGGSPADFIGDNWVQFIDPSQHERVGARWMKSVKNITYYQDTYTLVSGKRILVRAKPYKDPNTGKLLFWSGRAEEVTPALATSALHDSASTGDM